MRCSKCKKDFPEKEIQESHDVPCYLFIYSGNRKGQKNQADKFKRRWLCKKCHEEYEYYLNMLLIQRSEEFGKRWFSNG